MATAPITRADERARRQRRDHARALDGQAMTGYGFDATIRRTPGPRRRARRAHALPGRWRAAPTVPAIRWAIPPRRCDRRGGGTAASGFRDSWMVRDRFRVLPWLDAETRTQPSKPWPDDHRRHGVHQPRALRQIQSGAFLGHSERATQSGPVSGSVALARYVPPRHENRFVKEQVNTNTLLLF
jgi:hypothetical protein